MKLSQNVFYQVLFRKLNTITSMHAHYFISSRSFCGSWKGYFVSYFSRCFVRLFIDSVKFCTTWQRSSVKSQLLELEEPAKSLQRVFLWRHDTTSDIAKEMRRSKSMSSRSSSPSLLSINDVELSPSRDEDVLEGIKGEFENLESLTTREDAAGQYNTGSPFFEMNLLILNTFNDQLGFVASLCSPSSSRAE